MRNSVIAIASLAAGCSFSSNAAKTDSNTSHDGSGSGMIDAAIDAPPDGPNNDFGPAPYTVHVPTLPTAAVQLPGTINTDTDSHCSTTATWVSSSQPAACFIVGTMITSSGGNTVAIGSKPLVLVATSTISLTKGIDVSSHRAGATLGAGANAGTCDAFTAAPGAGNGGGGGGGAGGTFMTQGGNGASGDNNNAAGGMSPSPLTAAPTILRGGCAGQKGGTANSGDAANSGGAIYMYAAQSITISGGQGIFADGAGAGHGTHSSGGTGGGSGGMIVLYSPAITATGVAFAANGGGASSGGDQSNDGKDGSDPAMLTTPAPGGMGPGGDGGRGGILTTGGSGGGVGSSNQGGGGGGGGVGYIRSNVTLTGAFVSPAPDVVP